MRAVTDADRAIGQRIQTARKRQGMSLKGLAEALVVSVQQMQKYEAGVNRISAANLVIVAKLLQSDLRVLAGTEPVVSVPDRSSPRATVIADLFDRISDKTMRDAIYQLVKAAAVRSDDDAGSGRLAAEPARAE